MQKLDLEKFIQPNADFESCQYQILKILKEYESSFHKNRLFPAYDYLRELLNDLENVLIRKACLSTSSPVKKIKFDIPENATVFNPAEYIETEMNKIWDLIEWGYDEASRIFEEGQIIYQFVEDNTELLIIEDSVDSAECGCFLVPDNKTSELNFYKFLIAAKSNGINKNQFVSTELIETLEFQEIIDEELSFIGDKLVSEFPELTSTPVYAVRTELDFPFVETLFPVVKEMLTLKLSTH